MNREAVNFINRYFLLEEMSTFLSGGRSQVTWFPSPSKLAEGDGLCKFQWRGAKWWRLRCAKFTGTSALTVDKVNHLQPDKYCFASMRPMSQIGVLKSGVQSEALTYINNANTAVDADDAAQDYATPTESDGFFGMNALQSFWNRYIVQWVKYTFEIVNYQVCPLEVGTIVGVGSVFHNLNDSKTGTDAGGVDLETLIPTADMSIGHVRTLPLYEKQICPAARVQNTVANLYATFSDALDADLGAQMPAIPGRCVVTRFVPCYKMLNAVSQKMTGQAPDLVKHGSDIGAGPTVDGIDFFLIVAPFSGGAGMQVVPSGTITDAPFSPVMEVVFGNTEAPWTNKVFVRPSVEMVARFYDPILDTFGQTSLQDTLPFVA